MQIFRDYASDGTNYVFVIQLSDDDARHIFYGDTIVSGHAAEDKTCYFRIGNGNESQKPYFRRTESFKEEEDNPGTYVLKCVRNFASPEALLSWLVTGGEIPMTTISGRVGLVRFEKEK